MRFLLEPSDYKLVNAGDMAMLLENQDFAQSLKDSIERLWNGAEHFRPLPLANAARQIEPSREAYDRIGAAVNSRVKPNLGIVDRLSAQRISGSP